MNLPVEIDLNKSKCIDWFQFHYLCIPNDWFSTFLSTQNLIVTRRMFMWICFYCFTRYVIYNVCNPKIRRPNRDRMDFHKTCRFLTDCPNTNTGKYIGLWQPKYLPKQFLLLDSICYILYIFTVNINFYCYESLIKDEFLRCSFSTI